MPSRFPLRRPAPRRVNGHANGHAPSPADELRAFLRRFAKIARDVSYYHIGVGVSGAGDAEWHMQTHWMGWQDPAHRLERRKARPVDPHWFAECWKQSGTPYFVVNDAADLAVFLAFGGNALIAAPIAEEFLPDVIERITAADGEPGFRREPAAIGAPVRPAPLARAKSHPGRRCCVCGEPANARRQALRLRPVRPASLGGADLPQNCIVHCAACARWLEPRPDEALQELATEKTSVASGYLDMQYFRAWLATKS